MPSADALDASMSAPSTFIPLSTSFIPCVEELMGTREGSIVMDSEENTISAITSSVSDLAISGAAAVVVAGALALFLCE